MANDLLTNEELLLLLHSDQERAINYLFKQEYTYLCRVSNRYLNNEASAEDIVQDVFYELWKKRDRLNIKTAIRAYLRRATINKTLNFIRDNKMILEEVVKHPEIPKKELPEQLLEQKELRAKIDEAIDKLPPKARHVFILSRFEQMSYKEIAKELGISPKTVENHISKSLKFLRSYLKPHLNKMLLLTLMATNLF